MGSTNHTVQHNTKQSNTKIFQQIPPEYQVLNTKFNKKTQEEIAILKNTKNKQLYYLIKLNFLDKVAFKKTFDRIHSQSSQQANQSQFMLSCIRIWSRQLSSLCNNNYQIYAIYQYSQLNLRQEIKMRKIQRRKFQPSQIWTILQCCINAIEYLPNSFTFEPQKIFIFDQGKIKVINKQILTQLGQYRFVINESIYYAPQKISDFEDSFQQNGNEKTYEKQIIFSLGLSLLEAGTFQDARKCYNFQKQQFNKEFLQQLLYHMKQSYERWDTRLYQTICGMVEVEPNRRFSVDNLKEVLYIKERINESIGIEKQVDSRTTFDYNLSSKYSPKYLPVQNHKRSTSINTYPNQSVDSESFNKIFKNCVNISKTSQDYQSTQKKKYSKLSVKQVEPNSESFYVYQNQKNSRFPNFESIILQNSAQLRQEQSLKTLEPYLPNIPKILHRSNAKNKKDQSVSSSLLHYGQQIQKQNIQNEIANKTNLFEQKCKNPVNFQENKDRLKFKQRNQASKVEQIYQIYPPNEDKVKSQSFLMSQQSEGSLFNLTPEKCFTFNNIKFTNTIIDYHKVRYYQGSLKNGKRQGAGRLIFLDRRIYQGEFKNNQIDGYGVFYEGNKQPIYDGFWKNNRFQGQGILNNLNINMQASSKPIDHRNLNSIEARGLWLRYEGTFKQGIQHGKGFLLFANGQSFEGQFKQGLPQGKGKFRNLYGEYIIGAWSSAYYISGMNSPLNSNNQ